MSEEAKEETIKFEEWQKLDLRAGKILSVEDVVGADKLYKLIVKADKERTLLAGLKKHYTKEELIGKRCVVFCNLTPRVMKGITSEGMILAAVSENEEGEKVVLLQPEKDIEEGSRVR
jgi:methionine--tRNA ligase beta chain